MLTDTFAAVMLASSLACAVTTFGILAISRYEEWAQKYSHHFRSFAAGVLIAIAFLHITPESFKMGPMAPIFLLVGFLALYLTNHFLRLYMCHEGECEGYTVGVIPMIAIGFHSLIDGVIFAVTFNVSLLTGGLAAIGMVFHEFPEGIVTFILLTRGGFSRERSFLYAFLAAGLTTPLGALVTWPLIHRITGDVLGGLLAAAGGALLYVGATHLLSEVEKENRAYSILSFVGGVLIAVILLLLGE